MKKSKYVIGIDEVGRGALAGPVVVAAVVAAVNHKFEIRNPKQIINLKSKTSKGVKDSKKLTPKQREIWFDFIKKQRIPYAAASVPPKIIDKINISNAANLAAARAFQKLTKNYNLKNKTCKIFLDGGLYLPKSLNSKFPARLRQKTKSLAGGYILNSHTIIKGDEKIPAIALASIVAKVNRDRYMKKLHKKYPQYDFMNNVGYGTKKHIKALKKFGHSPIHRKSFKVR